MIAAFAGIAWYLIFTRWSYRHSHGRGTEISKITEIDVEGGGLVVRRGAITTHIGWRAITEIKHVRGATAILVDGADALLVPDSWFGRDKAARQAFSKALKRRGQA